MPTGYFKNKNKNKNKTSSENPIYWTHDKDKELYYIKHQEVGKLYSIWVRLNNQGIEAELNRDEMQIKMTKKTAKKYTFVKGQEPKNSETATDVSPDSRFKKDRPCSKTKKTENKRPSATSEAKTQDNPFTYDNLICQDKGDTSAYIDLSTKTSSQKLPDYQLVDTNTLIKHITRDKTHTDMLALSTKISKTLQTMLDDFIAPALESVLNKKLQTKKSKHDTTPNLQSLLIKSIQMLTGVSHAYTIDPNAPDNFKDNAIESDPYFKLPLKVFRLSALSSKVETKNLPEEAREQVNGICSLNKSSESLPAVLDILREEKQLESYVEQYKYLVESLETYFELARRYELDLKKASSKAPVAICGFIPLDEIIRKYLIATDDEAQKVSLNICENLINYYYPSPEPHSPKASTTSTHKIISLFSRKKAQPDHDKSDVAEADVPKVPDVYAIPKKSAENLFVKENSALHEHLKKVNEAIDEVQKKAYNQASQALQALEYMQTKIEKAKGDLQETKEAKGNVKKAQKALDKAITASRQAQANLKTDMPNIELTIIEQFTNALISIIDESIDNHPHETDVAPSSSPKLS